MTKELARYFFSLIDKDLYFSFEGMGLPNSACEWLENQLMQENFDKVEEFITKRYGEHENTSKPKRKLRAMTIGEHCYVGRMECKDCEYHRGLYYCDYSDFNKVNRGREKNKTYKTKDGKYILIEVKE